MTDALITIAEIVAAFGLAGVACWIGEKWLHRRQQDWQDEGNVRPRW